MAHLSKNLQQIDDAAKARQERAKQAKNLLLLVRNYRRGMAPPAVRKALGVAVLAGGVVWGGTYLVDLPFDFLLGMGAFFAAYWLTRKRSAYQTPAEHVYDLLADYEPHNRDSYAAFQLQARQGALDWDELADWLSHEVATLSADNVKSTEQLRLDKARARFIERDTAK